MDVKISGRLKKIAEIAGNKGPMNVLGDIGTDHGLLPVYALLNGIAQKAYASDLREGPLKAARKNTEQYGLSDRIALEQCSGVSGLSPDSGKICDTIVIAGMGGLLIRDILSDGLQRGNYTAPQRFILAPNTQEAELRRYLNLNGFASEAEYAICESGHVYLLIDCTFTGRGGTIVKEEEYITGFSSVLPEFYYLNALKKVRIRQKGLAATSHLTDDEKAEKGILELAESLLRKKVNDINQYKGEKIMTKAELAKIAFDECCNEKTTVRYGVKRGLPFWNVESLQFMYVPAFHFTAMRCCNKYRYDAVDELGVKHSFIADDCCVLLTPIWTELPEGVVRLTVTALNPDGSDFALVGARTFFRLAPFPGDTPPKVCSYRESAVKAYNYAMSQPFIQHWLDCGTPDPSYDLNVYPSKMIASLVKTMLAYVELCPDDSEKAMKVARNAADYLINITPREGALKDLPPTYQLDFCPDPDKYGIKSANWGAACAHFGTMMMIYPANVGESFVLLTKATGDRKYLDEALKIAEYYRTTIEPNNSWYLVRSCETGKNLTENYIAPLDSVTPFLKTLYNYTGDTTWKDLADKSIDYVVKTQLPTYNWEGQFEDSPLSTNYMNLTHYGPIALSSYFCEYYRDDPAKMSLAEELVRFAEDQFVIWKRPAPWKHHTPDEEPPYDPALWHTPCALEQYGWHVPIDASACTLIEGFLDLYKAGRGILYLAKARALCDQLTRVQHENGQIPTHWMNTPGAEKNFWFNCMFASCRTLVMMTEYENIKLTDD